MTQKYEIIDNFLPPSDFLNIKNTMFSNAFPWHYNPSILDYPNAESLEKLYFFTHKFYRDYVPSSNYISILDPIIKKLNAKSLIKIQANLYPNVNKYIESKFHRDYDFSHKGGVFYLNTNNNENFIWNLNYTLFNCGAYTSAHAETTTINQKGMPVPPLWHLVCLRFHKMFVQCLLVQLVI
jgi:hypothetical protein